MFRVETISYSRPKRAEISEHDYKVYPQRSKNWSSFLGFALILLLFFFQYYIPNFLAKKLYTIYQVNRSRTKKKQTRDIRQTFSNRTPTKFV